jgi:hypothetical protein
VLEQDVQLGLEAETGVVGSGFLCFLVGVGGIQLCGFWRNGGVPGGCGVTQGALLGSEGCP